LIVSLGDKACLLIVQGFGRRRLQPEAQRTARSLIC
jgi:hypothetical protein